MFGGADAGLAVLMGRDAAEAVCRGCVGAPRKRGASGCAFTLRLPCGVGHGQTPGHLPSQESVGPSGLPCFGPHAHSLPPRELPAPRARRL